jgi:hypothetical protein
VLAFQARQLHRVLARGRSALGPCCRAAVPSMFQKPGISQACACELHGDMTASLEGRGSGSGSVGVGVDVCGARRPRQTLGSALALANMLLSGRRTRAAVMLRCTTTTVYLYQAARRLPAWRTWPPLIASCSQLPAAIFLMSLPPPYSLVSLL